MEPSNFENFKQNFKFMDSNTNYLDIKTIIAAWKDFKTITTTNYHFKTMTINYSIAPYPTSHPKLQEIALQFKLLTPAIQQPLKSLAPPLVYHWLKLFPSNRQFDDSIPTL